MAHGISQLETRNWNFKGDKKLVKEVKINNECHFERSPGRYYLESFFEQRPALNADIAGGYSYDFEVVGTNAATACSEFSSTRGGIALTTAGADNDQVILTPHLDSKISAWSNVKWGTENQVIWECAITTGDDITNGVLLWAGLKLTNTPTVATDADQVFFRFSTDDSDTYWTTNYSIGGTDTSADTTLTVAVNTIYRFKITIDSSRIARMYINDKLYATTTALTNDVDFIPYVGIQALNTAAEHFYVHYMKISRILFE